MSKGNKQSGNREAKKPKADKKVILASPTFLKPDPNVRQGGKPSNK